MDSDLKICSINVSEVEPLPEDQIEQFRNEYISDAYIHEGDEGFAERMSNSCQLMFARWDWLQSNASTYVNMLRVKGFNDQNIQDCLSGRRPLCYKNEEIHSEFCSALNFLKESLEKEANIEIVKFIQTGSSVPGFSTNPCKGFADRPSKITVPDSSDVDVIIVAKGINDLAERVREQGSKVRKYPTVCNRDGKCDERLGFKNVSLVSESLKNFIEEWTQKLGGLQITFQEYKDDIEFAPWERPVPV